MQQSDRRALRLHGAEHPRPRQDNRRPSERRLAAGRLRGVPGREERAGQQQVRGVRGRPGVRRRNGSSVCRLFAHELAKTFTESPSSPLYKWIFLTLLSFDSFGCERREKI